MKPAEEPEPAEPPPRLLQGSDDYLHTVGVERNWNESRYVDFYDTATRVAGWFRIGMRPNEHHAEMSACLSLPDGRSAFFFERAGIEGNSMSAGGQEWTVDDPFRLSAVRYEGPMLLLDNPWVLTEPKGAFEHSPRGKVSVDLRVETAGLPAVMGRDQRHIDLIFLPGQADWHYQHLCWTTGTVEVDGQRFSVSGRGGKDHSWGPRNWLAKIYLRWLIAISDDDELGFMLVRAVGPDKTTRSGHVWEAGRFHLVDDFTMNNTYADRPPYHLLRTELCIRSGTRQWRATGTPVHWVPLRHRSVDEHGDPAVLRIVKSPTRWTFGDGRHGAGMSEIHDRIGADDVPVGLQD
jgi:hypothetical protein